MPALHRLIQRLLDFALPRAWADEALGDLREEFQEWRQAHGSARAALRLVQQSLGLLAYGVLDHAKHLSWVMQDLPATLKRLLRRPAIPLVAALTLGPVLGAAGAFGSLLSSALVGPLPHADPEGLVIVSHDGGELPGQRQSEALHRRYRARLTSLRSVGLFQHRGANVVFPDGARRVPVVRATTAALRAVGADVELGRLLGSADDTVTATPTALLTRGAWMARWNGDPSVVGRRVEVDGRPREIIGVLAPDIRLPGPEPELVLSAALSEEASPPTAFTWTASLGRLNRGADRATAAEEVEAIFGQVASEDPRLNAVSDTPGGIAPRVVSVRQWHAQKAIPVLTVGVGGSLVLLVLTGAAVLTLLLSTTDESARRTRVRQALGATRSRLRALAAMESGAALAGAYAVGAIGAGTTVRGLGTHVGIPVESWSDPGRAAVVAVLCGLLIVPAMAALGNGAADRATTRLRTWRPGRRSLLLGAQAAAAVLLLTALAGAARSAWTLSSRDLGFEASELLTFGVVLPDQPYGNEPRRAVAFHEAVKARLGALPEVEAASYGLGVPVSHPGWAKPWEVQRPADTTAVPASHQYRRVGGDYFDVLGIPIVVGRAFRGDELSGARRAVVVNEALAHRYWGDPGEALGQRIRPAGSREWIEIVGVVGNTADRGAAASPPAMIYEALSPLGDSRELLFIQHVMRGPSLGVQTVRAARRALSELDAQVPAFAFETGEGLVRRDTARERLAFTFLAGTGLAGLLAAALGLGGLVLQTIARHTREIGVRKALGGSSACLRRASLAPIWRPVVMGMSVGLALVAVGLRVPSTLLHDGASWGEHAGIAVLVLTPILVAAGHLGSRRIVRIEPAEAFRE